MTDEFEKRLQTIDQNTLTPLVRRLLEDDQAEILNWDDQPIEGGFGDS